MATVVHGRSVVCTCKHKTQYTAHCSLIHTQHAPPIPNTPWGRKTNLCTFPQSWIFPYKTLETEQISMYRALVLLNYGKGHNTSYLI